VITPLARPRTLGVGGCEPGQADGHYFVIGQLASITPGTLSKTLFTTGGSDAIEVALKIARAATGRFKTISFWDSVHGAGFGASSIGGEQLFRSGPAGPLLPGTEHVAPFACYRCPYGYPDEEGRPRLDLCRLTCANFVRYVLEKEGDVAAVIAEPIRSVPYVPPPGFWHAMRGACDAHGAILAATMLLTLPGLPLLYTGEEVGAVFEPYDEGPVLSWTDPHGLREHYAALVALRRAHAPLRSQRIELLETSHPESVLAYVRPGEQRGDDIVVLLNYDAKPTRAALPVWALEGTASLVDLMSGAAIPIASQLPTVDLPAWGARVLRRGGADQAR
jgi:Aminotransferase class-III/Maltogenic Amylase, C-terminal domain